jgi:hypothetical protein
MPRDVRPAEVVSAFTAGLLASIRFILAADLGLLLFWALGEITWSVGHDKAYSWLWIFFGIMLLVALVVLVWRWIRPEAFGAGAAATGSLNAAPLAFLDAMILLSAVFVSDRLDAPLTTPLLYFVQTIVHKLMS